MGALIGDLLAVARAESDAMALVALEPLDLREAARGHRRPAPAGRAQGADA